MSQQRLSVSLCLVFCPGNMDNDLRGKEERTFLVNSAPNIYPKIIFWLSAMASVLSMFQRPSCTARKKEINFERKTPHTAVENALENRLPRHQPRNTFQPGGEQLRFEEMLYFYNLSLILKTLAHTHSFLNQYK